MFKLIVGNLRRFHPESTKQDDNLQFLTALSELWPYDGDCPEFYFNLGGELARMGPEGYMQYNCGAQGIAYITEPMSEYDVKMLFLKIREYLGKYEEKFTSLIVFQLSPHEIISQ